MASKSENRRLTIWINGKEVQNNIKAITAEAHKLRQETVHLNRGTAEYRSKVQELRATNKIISQHYNQVRGISGVWKNISAEVRRFGMIAIGALGLRALTGQINNLIQRAARLDEAMRGVRKTTGLTEEQVKELSSSFSALNTRTARTELLEMAKVAGKLGITAQRDVMGFVSAMDKLVIAMGEDLGDANDVARALGKIVESFGVTRQFGIEDALLKTGSVINELGKSSTAAEGNIVSFTRRLAGIAPIANVAIEDVMGLGAALDALGQTTEVSGTAVTKLLIQMAKNIEAFARIAGMEVGEFKRLMNEDANEALLAVLEQVGKTNSGMSQLTETLGDMGTDGARVVGVMGTLANNIDFVRKQQAIARGEFQRGTSVLKEYELMNNSLEASLLRVRKRIWAMFMDSRVIEGLSNFVRWMDRALASSAKESDAMEQQRFKLNVLVDTLTTANLGQEERNRIIQEIQAIYPDFLKNIDIETASNEELRNRLQEVNDELMARIILKRQDEEIDKKREKIAKLWESRFERQKRIMTLINKAEEEFGVVIDQNADLATKYAQAVEQLSLQFKDVGIAFDKSRQLVKSLSDAYKGGTSGLLLLNHQYDRELSLMGLLQEEREDMRRQLVAEGAIREDVASHTGNLVQQMAQLTAELESLEKQLAAMDPDSWQFFLVEAQVVSLKEQITALGKSTADAVDELESNITTLESLEAKLKALRDELKTIDVTSPEFFAKRAEIAALEARIASLTGKLNDQSKELERLQKMWSELFSVKAMLEFEDKTWANLQAILDAATQAERELANLEKDLFGDLLDFRKQLGDLPDVVPGEEKLQAELEQRRELIDTFLHDDITRQVLHLEMMRQLTLENTQLTENERKDIIASIEAQIAAIRMGSVEQAHIREAQLAKQAMDYITDGFTELGRMRIDQATAQWEIEEKRMRAAEKSDAEIREARIAHFAETEKALKRQERIKRVSVAMDRTATALAMVKATYEGVTAAASSSKHLPFPANLLAIAATIGAIIAAVASIKSALGPIENQVPQAFEGGHTEQVIGAQDGRKYRARVHKNFLGGYTTEPTLLVGERGNEYVVNSTMMKDPYVLDQIKVFEAIRVNKQMAAGGFTRSSTATPEPSEPLPINATGTDPALAAAIERNSRLLEQNIRLLDMLYHEGVQSVWDFDRFRKGWEKANTYEEKSRVG